MRRILPILLAFVAGLLGAVPAQAAVPTAVLAMTFNACGNICRHGEVDVTAQNIAYQVRSRNAAVAMLQELCYSQFLGVQRKLAASGYTAVFGQATTGSHCADVDRRHGRGFGVALFVRGSMNGLMLLRLPSPSRINAEPRVALAATAMVSGRSFLVVTTHTAPSGPNLVRQMAAIGRWLTPLAESRTVIFGGDLNSMPDNADLDPFYAVFNEADVRSHPLPTFQPTSRKIDYLFGSFLGQLAVGTGCTGYSDHCMYFGLFQ